MAIDIHTTLSLVSQDERDEKTSKADHGQNFLTSAETFKPFTRTDENYIKNGKELGNSRDFTTRQHFH